MFGKVFQNEVPIVIHIPENQEHFCLQLHWCKIRFEIILI